LYYISRRRRGCGLYIAGSRRIAMSNFNFHKDLARAEETEAEVAKILAKKAGPSYLEVSWGHGKAELDIQLTTIFGSTTFELKEDFAHAKYGNIAIEYWSRGKPSGINVTTAKFWIQKVHEQDGSMNLYMISCRKLRDMILYKRYKRKVENGGDFDSGTKLFLFDGLMFKEEAVHLHEY
jgi:hypothetical protein